MTEATVVNLIQCPNCSAVHSGDTCPRCGPRPIRAEDVTGLPPDWKPSEGNPGYMEQSDLDGHRIIDGRCTNDGCDLILSEPVRAGRCAGAKKFVPRAVSWCPTCLKPFEGAACKECP